MIFQPVDVQGPAHRGAAIQQLAQAAAQNVMRRQRMKALVRKGAQNVGSQGGPGQPFRSALNAHPMGAHPSIMQPGGGMNQLIQSLVGQGQGAPMIPVPGQFNPGGGGGDFQSLPDPNDPSQSPQSTAGGIPPLPPQPPLQPGAAGGVTDTGGQPYTGGSPGAVSGGTPPYIGGAGGGVTNAGGGMSGYIPLGGGLFYDPGTDKVIGGGAPSGKPVTSING